MKAKTFIKEFKDRIGYPYGELNDISEKGYERLQAWLNSITSMKWNADLYSNILNPDFYNNQTYRSIEEIESLLGDFDIHTTKFSRFTNVYMGWGNTITDLMDHAEFAYLSYTPYIVETLVRAKIHILVYNLNRCACKLTTVFTIFNSTDIDESYHVHNSKNIIYSGHVQNSEEIKHSTYVRNSKNVKHASNIFDSDGVENSSYVYDSIYVKYSKHIKRSYNIEYCNNITSSKHLDNCSSITLLDKANGTHNQNGIFPTGNTENQLTIAELPLFEIFKLKS